MSVYLFLVHVSPTLLAVYVYLLYFKFILIMIFIQARDADQRGDMTTAITHGRISLGLNITSLVSWVIIAIVGISLLAVLVIGAGSDSYCTSSYRYNYYYGYDTSYYYCFD